MLRFAEFVSARWPTPEDALFEFFADAQAAALEVGAQLTELPDLDGVRRYLPSQAGKRDKRQFHVASVTTDPDGTSWPAITFKSFKHGGASHYWKPRDLAWQIFLRDGREDIGADTARVAAYAERARLAKEQEQARAVERDATDQLGRVAAADAARIAWDAASLDCGAHAYLLRKGVAAYGLRVATTTMRARLWDAERARWIDDAIVVRVGDLLVPVRLPDGQLVNVQRIDATGRKLFLRGGQKRATHFRIQGTGPAWLCEGYATGASVHAATGAPVVVAFDAGNLIHCASLANAVAADNDASGTGQRAAETTGLQWTCPAAVGDDFNDLHQRQGIDAVLAALMNLRQPPLPEAPAYVRPFELPAADVPPGRADALRVLGRIPDASDAAAFAWALAKRLSMGIPARGESIESISKTLRDALPSSILAGATIDAIAGGIRWIIDRRRAGALAAVRPSHAALERHTVERHDSLPMLRANDYRGVIVLRAPMGSGKTQKVGLPFSSWASQQDGRFVALAHRQSLIAELSARLGCAHYQRIDGEDAVHVDALAACLPSIVKADHAQVYREARWVFIDEISQVVRSLAARVTVADRKQMSDVLAALRELVSRADCVIVADAGIDDRTIEFIESCRPGERFRVIDADIAPSQAQEAEFGFGPEALHHAYGDMLAELADGRRLWVACGEKSRAVECARLLETSGRRVLLVNSDNSGNREQAEFLAAPDRMSRLYDAVVASPVISSGVSIEHREFGAWFHRVFVLASGSTVTPADAMQMARRVRYLTSLSVVVTASNRSEIDSADAILSGLSEAASLEGRARTPTSLDGLVADIEASDARQRADFAGGLWWLLEAAGWAVRSMQAGNSAVDAESMKLLRADIDREQRNSLLAARDLTDFEARRLRERPALAEADQAALLRHRIVRDLGLQEALCEADLDAWDAGRGPRAWDRFTAAIAGTAEAATDGGVADLHRLRFGRARVLAYRELFDGFKLAPGFRITSEVAAVLLGRMYGRRQLLAVLGLVPAKWAGDRFGLPAGNAATRAVTDLFERMGLKLIRARNNRKAKMGAKSASFPLEEFTTGFGTHRGIVDVMTWYVVDSDSWARTAELAARRNSRRVLDAVPRESADDRYWHAVRRDIMARAMPADEAARLILAKCRAQQDGGNQRDSSGRTYGARVAVTWLRWVYAPEWRRCAA
ncbi:plasmid replication protein, CyRepA1 family [Xanthomonas campestris pv. campestris]|uniref:plasmid replication protein, CyRepA1 family n=1 Tax=Xanthomonas campestris TaxID=339 RepID=UPI0020C9A11A|nr:plasmid replication protein, CyRepA1 family [Xanthomonas campestris]MEA0763422.1 toprim domain-containing protein [Xanthomonas campestris pv. campestris]MEB1225136.1 plasmid replication protein, CyRepA1 family [Xanthomonas campestris pv. campestris]MEB1245826.1 plasmid replication protein, CyRepA1 family [Xanthomonas campestris pv. campestris]MEB1254128.1 plasmid replication protein, CyRepA1 family [Xanthomonas campestris pv. campestris]MEB1295422.1 plasmid replication protein, CyRepA1 fami